ncbi:hypothetical protein AMTRI_Chr02g263020 [Amborella trichopoda]
MKILFPSLSSALFLLSSFCLYPHLLQHLRISSSLSNLFSLSIPSPTPTSFVSLVLFQTFSSFATRDKERKRLSKGKVCKKSNYREKGLVV